MEKRTNIGIKGQDFYGHCEQCLTSCGEEIELLINGFSRGFVAERNGYQLGARGDFLLTHSSPYPNPSFDVIQYSNIDAANLVLDINSEGQTFEYPKGPGPQNDKDTFRYSNAGPDGLFSQIPPYNNCRTFGSSHDGTWRAFAGGESEARAYYSRPITDELAWKGIKAMRCQIGETVLDAAGNPVNRLTGYSNSIMIAQDHYRVPKSTIDYFPLCGDLEVYDSSLWQYRTMYQPPQPFDPYSRIITPPMVPTNGESFFLFMRSVCSDSSASQRSQHPHMVGVSDGKTKRQQFSTDMSFPSKYNRGRKFDNHEEVKKVGIYRTVHLERFGSVDTWLVCDPNDCGSKQYVGFDNPQNPCTYGPHPIYGGSGWRTCKYPSGYLPEVPCRLLTKYRFNPYGLPVLLDPSSPEEEVEYDTYQEAFDALIAYGNKKIPAIEFLGARGYILGEFRSQLLPCQFAVKAFGRVEVPEVWAEACDQIIPVIDPTPFDYERPPDIIVPHPRVLVEQAYWKGWGAQFPSAGSSNLNRSSQPADRYNTRNRIEGFDTSARLSGFKIVTSDDFINLDDDTPVGISGERVLIGIEFYQAPLSHGGDGAAINKTWNLNFGSPVYQRELDFQGNIISIPPLDVSLTLK